MLTSTGANSQRFVYGSKNTPDYMIVGSTKYRLVPDPTGSIRLVVNTSTGAISERIDYDEFGNITNDTSPGFQPFGFAGGLYDQDTKLVHFGARDYDPSVGRWLSKDPIRFGGGDTNLYGYLLEDPINRIDPSGTQGAEPFNPPILIPPGEPYPVDGPPSDQGPIDPPDLECFPGCPPPQSVPAVQPKAVTQCTEANPFGRTSPLLTNTPPNPPPPVLSPPAITPQTPNQ